MDVSGRIFDIKPYALNDGPGIRTTVFFKGCPLNCAWCHNPEGIASDPHFVARPDRCILCNACVAACPDDNPMMVSTPLPVCPVCGSCIEACPAEAREIVGEERSVKEIMEILLKGRPFFEESGGGATFSGGEPLGQPAFLLALLKACKAQGIHTTVDTSGFAPRKTVEEVADLAGLFLFDIKVMDETLHQRYTGVGNSVILANLAWLSNRGAEIIIRQPLIPGVNDTENETRALGTLVTGLSRTYPVHLMPYHDFQRGKHDQFGIPMPELPPKERGRNPVEVAAQLEGMGVEVKMLG